MWKPTIVYVKLKLCYRLIYSHFGKGCKVHATIPKGIVDGLSSLFFKEIWKNGTEAIDFCLRMLKESNNRRLESYSVRNSVLIIFHITFRDCRVHISSDNLSRNSCILVITCLVPRPHYYARPMRFGSRGPRKFLRPRQTRRSETFCLTWDGSFGSERLFRADEKCPAAMESTEDKEVNRALLFYARFHCWKSFGLSISFISLN